MKKIKKMMMEKNEINEEWIKILGLMATWLEVLGFN